jgi:hypothetical protein
VLSEPIGGSADDALVSKLIDAAFGVVRKDINPARRPPTLFHFTDMAELLAIVKSNTIRAPLVSGVNDATELHYGLELAKQLIANGGLKPNGVLLQLATWFLDPGNSSPGAQMRWHPFVASFFASEASAVHWLHHGRQGTGVAIGLDSMRLVVEAFELVEVIYDAAEQRELIQASVSALVQQLEDAHPGASDDTTHPLFATAAHLVSQAITALAARFKAPAFAAEQEWRLITYAVEGVSHAPAVKVVDVPTELRTRDSRLIVYKQAAYERLPISELVFGNACATDPNDYSVRLVLAPGVSCRRSGVPVRPE